MLPQKNYLELTNVMRALLKREIEWKLHKNYKTLMLLTCSD